MDPVKMGKFLACLRKEAGLTQEALGQILGVTNKTVSRWENGNYLPDLDVLQAIGMRFGVSIDELIQGERVSGAVIQNAPETDAAPERPSSRFALAERITYWRRKWLREHLFSLILYGILCGILPFAACRLGIICSPPLLMGCFILLALAFYLTARNRMMIYIEARAFTP